MNQTLRRQRLFDRLFGGTTALIFGASAVASFGRGSGGSEATAQLLFMWVILLAMIAAGIGVWSGTPLAFKVHAYLGGLMAFILATGLIFLRNGLFFLGLALVIASGSIYSFQRMRQIGWEKKHPSSPEAEAIAPPRLHQGEEPS